MRVILLDSKAVDEVIPVSFDFSRLLSSIDSVIVTITVRKGVDATPSTLLFNTAEIKGTMVSQLIKSGIDGVIYKIKAKAISGDLQYSLPAYLPVKEPM
ncbi:MAG: hypothetical protein GQ532_08950 [Methylomarinum sp.]|nr:hypothetical protein [Methylomarinum sp.]